MTDKLNANSSASPALELRGIDLHYGYVKALMGVDFSVQPGEVVGLLGDNGAGKSTLLKVLSGAHIPTHGTIHVHGQPVRFSSPRDAAAAGIQMVYQDLALVDAQDIATNLCLGRETLRSGPLGWLGFVDKKAMRRESERELDQLGVRTAPVNRSVEMLSGGQRQVVAIARAAVRITGNNNGVLLLDEPTAALGYEQTQLVRQLIRNLADRGVAIVIVTHNLPLCFAVTDRVVVLNRGRKVADVATAQTNNDEVVGYITGARGSMFESDR
jgi:simple sugar transport system ATP-binding protein